jgi:hypothetical protein
LIILFFYIQSPRSFEKDFLFCSKIIMQKFDLVAEKRETTEKNAYLRKNKQVP